MHLLHITPYYAPAYSFGGVVRAVEGLSQALVTRGHDVTVLTTDALSLDARYNGAIDEMRDGVRVLRCRNALYALRRMNLSTPMTLRSRLADVQSTVDVVHLHEFRTIENLIALATLPADMPVLLSPHGTLTTTTGRSWLKRGWDAVFSQSLAQRISRVIALTAQEQHDAQQLWSRLGADSPMSVIPNGIDPHEFAHLPNPAAFRQQWNLGDKRVILFMGRLHRRKGVALLARAFKQAALTNTALVIAGPDEGMRETLTTLANDNIVLTGYLDPQARLAAFAAADIFALPAVGEGLSIATLEALAAGVPVLISPDCHLPQVADAHAGRIVEREVSALASALTHMLNTDDLSAMSANARQLVAERFTWDVVAEQVEAVYQQARR